MNPGVPGYTTKELAEDTLPDFERLFETHPAPGAYQCWCLYNHRPGPLPRSEELPPGAKRDARNRRQKRELLEEDRSHGILVYAKGEPVGWCQYGAAEELPRVEKNAGYRRLAADQAARGFWRITCFVVDRKYRRLGVASAALKAALEAIGKRGGGHVEAYPITRWGAYSDYRGTVSMFLKEGFTVVGRFGKSNVVMRRTI